MRARRLGFGALALVACFGLGAALGLWVYTLVGGHVYVAPRPIIVISALAGLVCAGIGAYALVRVATGAGANTGATPRDLYGP
jgi:hypothetical protein